MLTEARGLLVVGWSRDAQARDRAGNAVSAWSDEARSWSLLGALLASWYVLHGAVLDVAAHSLDARTLGDATEALGDAIGTADLENWNDEPERTAAEVIEAVDRAIDLLS
jgi:hypothetical protein